MIDFDSRLSRTKTPEINISGFDSPEALAFLLNYSSQSKQNKNLIIVSNEKVANQLSEALLFYNTSSKIKYLTHFHAQMYSEVVPSQRIITQRLDWLNHAQESSTNEDLFFIATLPGLMQKTLPMETFLESSFELNPNDEIPSNISQKLQRIVYIQVPLVEDPGSFSMRGGILDIYSPAHEQPLRFELFGDIIDSIRYFDPSSQRNLNIVNRP